MKFAVFADFFDFKYVAIGNFWYFFFIALIAGVGIFLYRLCGRKGKKFTDRFVLILAWVNFALHFFKQFFPGYRQEWPDGLADSLFPNLCAALIFATPFILMWGRKTWKDYLYYIGIASGIVAITMPTGAMRYADFPEGFLSFDYAIEVMRFYFCHAVLIYVGLLTVAKGSHELSFKRIKWIPLTFAFFFLVVGLHAIIWGPIAKLQGFPTEWVGENGVLNNLSLGQQIANQSMVFGPQPALDPFIRPLAQFFIPYLMVYSVGDTLYYTPILWMAPFFVLTIYLLAPLVTYPFARHEYALMQETRRQEKAMKKAKKESISK